MEKEPEGTLWKRDDPGQTNPPHDLRVSALQACCAAGSQNATNAGLYHYTTTTNHVKEADSVVDIGVYYVGVGTDGAPLDTDGGGAADWLEDLNGNGIVEEDETDFRSGYAADDFVTTSAPGYPRCEYLVDPLGVDARVLEGTNWVQRPRLSWILNSSGSRQTQKAYQILVASSTNNLASNCGNIWNSLRTTETD